MADFFDNLSDNLNLDRGRILNRKIDKDRDNFIKGLRYTKSGQKEDPTYLGFRFIFEFGISPLDPENFLPPSPLFKELETEGLRDNTILDTTNATDTLLKISKGSANGSYLTDMGFFKGAYRTFLGVNPLKESPVAYMGAQKYLYERWDNVNPSPGGGGSVSTQDRKGLQQETRHRALQAFKETLRNINAKSPWYFQSITGLKDLVSHKHTMTEGAGANPYRKGTLTINCLESIDMRISAMAELYKKATYDYIHHRRLVPSNLLKFRMYIVISEIRNIQLRNDINDVLNPFSVPLVSSATNFISSLGQGGGVINPFSDNFKYGETPPSFLPREEYNTTPYVMIYQLDQCEFDFDETTPIPTNFDNGTGTATPVTNSFKIHVGRVKDLKLQYNLMEDLIAKKDIFKGLLLADHFSMEGSVISPAGALSDPENSPGEFFAKLASNFVTNTVNNIKNDLVSAASSAILGNAYGFQINQIGEAASSAQQLGAFLRDGTPPFSSGNPQKNGLGGPKERVYPPIISDLYGTVPEGVNPNLGNVLALPPTPGFEPNDQYPGVPGKELGLPGRVYPTARGDEYPDAPGEDLGVPGRIYPTASGDAYVQVPGIDLGLPQRQYRRNNRDEYTGVSGPDLGVPGRIYPAATGDEYTTNPGSDLGLPARQYPVNTGDEYTGVTGRDLGVPGRVYPQNTQDLYATNPGPDLGLPARQYPVNTGDEYPGVAGGDLGVPQRVYPQNNLDDYPSNPGPDLGLPTRQYPVNTGDEYPTSAGPDLGAPQRIYPQNNLDDYPTTPGPDLGLPARQYPVNNFDEYPTSAGVDLGTPQRIYPQNNLDDYPTTPGPDLGLPSRQYPVNNFDEYPTSAGVDLGTPQRIYPQNNLDDYPTTPGPDLGLPSRQYPVNTGDEYPTSAGVDLGAPQRIYTPNNLDDYPTNPGPDLGLPGRQYPANTGDEYPTSAGTDLGTPQRIYTPNNLDDYPTNPGADLGLPGRQYPANVKDEYPTSSGSDLGAPQRLYPPVIGDEYPGAPGRDGALPERQYTASTIDEYEQVPGRALGAESRIYQTVNENLYQNLGITPEEIRSRVYPELETEETPRLNETLYKSQDKIEYPRIERDEYPETT